MLLTARPSGFLSISDFLIDFANRRANGYLKVSANGIDWFIYFTDGQIFYVNFSVAPLDRLELYIDQKLQHYQKSIDQNVFKTVRGKSLDLKLDDYYPSYDYQALYSLVNSQQLSNIDAASIVQKVSKESLQNFLLLTTYEYDFVQDSRQFPILWSADASTLIDECNSENRGWQALGRFFYSPYLRPYLLKNDDGINKYEYLRKLLIGGDFYQLAVFLNLSPLRVAQNLAPLVKDGVVGLHSPLKQYAYMPKFWLDDSGPVNPSFPFLQAPKYKVVCVDNSPTILRRIHDFLDEDDFDVTAIQDSREALVKVIEVQPHIILTDVDMFHLDGYQLCKMLRCHSQLKTTPIIMVTSNQGWINRSKAAFYGVSNYITKPFTHNDLNKVVFKHLTY
jgi:two-component system, chemotaxis family, response regulator PixG